MHEFHSSAAEEAGYTLDLFTRSYIMAAYWTDTGDKEQPDSETEASPEFIERARADCADFQASAFELLARYCAIEGRRQAGIDFWLTRNGHGAGFWDRGLGELGDKLTDAAHAAGSCDLYAGDDGLLYFI